MANSELKAAAVHASPVYMNKSATLQKVVTIIEAAASQQVELLVFPETFVPGYPYFINCYPPAQQTSAIQQYAAQSVVVPDDLRTVQAACQKHKVTIALGISERMKNGHTCFNSISTIDRDGTILGIHRKLQPTFAERYVWGQGSGATLRSYNTRSGYKLGGLACWEHTLNGARQALIEQGQHIHAGCWPPLDGMQGFEEVFNVQVEALMKTHALTAQVFVLAATGYVDDTAMRWMEENLGPQQTIRAGDGWTAIIHPFCSVIAGPETGKEDKLVIAEIDLNQISMAKVWIDGNGHYKRPEVLSNVVDTNARWPDDIAVAGPIPFRG